MAMSSPRQTGLWGAFLRELDRREPEGLDHNGELFCFRPTTAEAILQDWVKTEARLLWWPGCRLLEVERVDSRIAAVRIEIGGEQRRLRCKVVIDGSDRVTRSAGAGSVSFRLGGAGAMV